MTSIKNCLVISAIGMAIVAGMGSCGNTPAKDEEKSAEKVAEEQNDEKFTTKSSEKDAQFMVDVVAANHAEIEMARLAQKQDTDQGIKKVAADLERSHQQLLSELQELAAAKAISVPAEMTDEAKKELTKIADDKNFSKSWCKALISKHEKTIEKFEKAEQDTNDGDIRNWIARSLPTIRMHLDELNKTKDNIK
jgi:putative membrane protein